MPRPGPSRVAAALPGLSDEALLGVALTSWGNALIAGRVRPDDVADLASDGREHCLLQQGDALQQGVAGETDEVGLALGLAGLRADNCLRLRLVLPIPGDALGLPGPPALTERALGAGAAVLTVPASPAVARVALVPEASPAQVRWRRLPADGGGDDALPDLPAAERAMKEGLLEATETLTALDVARRDPEAASSLVTLRADPVLPLAPGHPARAVRVLTQAWRLLAIISVATRNEGGALTGSEMTSRRESLLGLARTARHAVAAAAGAVD